MQPQTGNRNKKKEKCCQLTSYGLVNLNLQLSSHMHACAHTQLQRQPSPPLRSPNPTNTAFTHTFVRWGGTSGRDQSSFKLIFFFCTTSMLIFTCWNLEHNLRVIKNAKCSLWGKYILCQKHSECNYVKCVWGERERGNQLYWTPDVLIKSLGIKESLVMAALLWQNFAGFLHLNRKLGTGKDNMRFISCQ